MTPNPVVATFGAQLAHPTASGGLPCCPRCSAQLREIDGLGLCGQCGYCPLLDTLPPPEKKAWRSGFALLLAVMLGILALVLLIHHRFPANTEERSIGGVLQLLAGMGMLATGQLLAAFLMAAREGRFGIKDVFIPSLDLWVTTLRHLPATRWPVSLVLWGLVLITSAFCLGDVTYWARARPVQKRKEPNPQQQLRALEEEAARSEREARATVAVLRDRQNRPQRQPASESNEPPTMQCVVVGYLPSEDGKAIRGLLMATIRDGRLVQTGVVEQGYSPDDRGQLFRQLRPLERLQPPTWWKGPAPKNVVWVQADSRKAMVCEVEGQNGKEGTEKPDALRFKGVVPSEP